MNPSRFFMPNMGIGSVMRNSYMVPRGIGLFGRIGNGLKTFNWSGLLSGANKTLNVMNQTIPLIMQAGPMVNNMRSMLQLAKAFGNETVSNKNFNRRNNFISNNINSRNDTNNIAFNNTNYQVNGKMKNTNSNYPVFFV